MRFPSGPSEAGALGERTVHVALAASAFRSGSRSEPFDSCRGVPGTPVIATHRRKVRPLLTTLESPRSVVSRSPTSEAQLEERSATN